MRRSKEFGARYFSNDFWQHSASEIIQKEPFFATSYRRPCFHRHHPSPRLFLGGCAVVLQMLCVGVENRMRVGRTSVLYVYLCLSPESG